MTKDLSSPLDLKAIQARVDAAPEGPWFLSDCEGTLQIWREAVLRNVTRDESGEITGYRDPASWRPGDLIGEWDLDTWDPGQDDDDDRIRAIAQFITAARTDVPALLAEAARLQARVEDLDAKCAGLEGEQASLRQQLNAEAVVYYALCDERDALRDQVAGRDATIQRVRDVHAPEDRGTGELLCKGCATHVTFTPYAKCKTRIALDGDPAESEAADG